MTDIKDTNTNIETNKTSNSKTESTPINKENNSSTRPSSDDNNNKSFDKNTSREHKSFDKKTRFTKKPHKKSNLVFEVLVQRRVSTTREGGEKMSFSVLSVCGDKEGSAGLGLGKAGNFSDALAKANNKAKKNMISIFKGAKISTIFHNKTIKKGGITIVITRAGAGKGIKANGVIEKICRAIGITELSAKIHGSNNDLNVSKLFFLALSQQIPTKQIQAHKAFYALKATKA